MKRWVPVYHAGTSPRMWKHLAFTELEKTENVLSNSVGGKQNLQLHLLRCASLRKIIRV